MSTRYLYYFLSAVLFTLNTPLQSAPQTSKNQPLKNQESQVDETNSVTFVPPSGWRVADLEALPKNVKIMVVGKGKYEYPPSLNLTTEEFKGSIKDYLKIVKNINEAQKSDWKDLGFLKTEAGEASLSQVDSKTEWGHVRLMHVITVKNGIAYILTAAALKEEFPQFYKDFFNSMKSLKINKNIFDIVKDPKRRENLRQMTTEMQKAFEQAQNPQSAYGTRSQFFHSESFQQNYWIPYQAKIDHSFPELSEELKHFFYEQVQNNLTGQAG